MKRRVFHSVFLFCFGLVLIYGGCKDKTGSKQQEVVVYTSLDKVFSEPVLNAFEKETGRFSNPSILKPPTDKRNT
jgi:hypothetical protein